MLSSLGGAAKRKLCTLAAALALACAAFAFWPVDSLIIRPENPPSERENARFAPEPVFAAPAPLGQEFHTSYIHSVQRTSVLDRYRIVNERIWTWRESVQSHNAGLPFQRPEFGRFYLRPPWMVFEGGRRAEKDIALRVGDARFGRNTFAWGGDEPVLLYACCPGRLLLLSVERRPLLFARVAAPFSHPASSCPRGP